MVETEMVCAEMSHDCFQHYMGWTKCITASLICYWKNMILNLRVARGVVTSFSTNVRNIRYSLIFNQSLQSTHIPYSLSTATILHVHNT